MQRGYTLHSGRIGGAIKAAVSRWGRTLVGAGYAALLYGSWCLINSQNTRVSQTSHKRKDSNVDDGYQPRIALQAFCWWHQAPPTKKQLFFVFDVAGRWRGGVCVWEWV